MLTTRVYDVRPLARAGLDSFQIADAITETLRPETWPSSPEVSASPAGFIPAGPPRHGEREAGRRTGTGITTLNGAVVVTHNQDMHRRIVALLDQLGRFAERPAEE
jgi:hypothetical protein